MTHQKDDSFVVVFAVPCSFVLLLLLLFFLGGEEQGGSDIMIPVIPPFLHTLTCNHSYRELTDISILSCFIHLRYVVRMLN